MDVNELNKKVYCIAGCKVRFAANFRRLHWMCRDYAVSEEPELELTITKDDIEFERKKTLEEEKTEGIPHQEFRPSYYEATAACRKLTEKLLEDDIILFHGSAVAVDGQCYLFTAKSGTGKSTHTKLWRELLGDRAVMINDDKPLLRVTDRNVTVYGTPWNGKHHLGTNGSAPLRALCILERGEKNEIHPVTSAEAMPMLLQQCNRTADPAKAIHTLDLIGTLAESVNLYRLHCNMDPEAAKVAFEAMHP